MVWTPHDRLWNQRTRVAAGVAIVGTAIALVGAYPSYVEARGPSHSAEDEIEKLSVCYALGTDAIGRGDLEGGKAIYEDCFTEDAVLDVYLPGQDTSGPPFFSTVGTDSWAEFVEDTFVGSDYVVTQHLIGTVNAQVTSGREATMTSYLNATHVRSNGTINIANGTYYDQVVRDRGRWKISRRSLVIINLIDLGTPAP